MLFVTVAVVAATVAFIALASWHKAHQIATSPTNSGTVSDFGSGSPVGTGGNPSTSAIEQIYSPSSALQISRIRIDSEACEWNNVYAADVSGFENDGSNVWKAWWSKNTNKRWHIDITDEGDRTLRTVFSYMTRRAKGEQNIPESLAASGDSYESFRAQFVVGKRLDILRDLRALWPSDDTLKALRSDDGDTYLALHEFAKGFYRDEHPVFDIVLKNVSSQDVVLHSAILAMQNVQVMFAPEERADAAAPKVLEVTGEFDWILTNYDDPAYRDWLKEPRRSFGRDTFAHELQPSRLEVSPPLVVPANESLRIRLRFMKGYHWPCEIKFGFIHDADMLAASRWYGFKP